MSAPLTPEELSKLRAQVAATGQCVIEDGNLGVDVCQTHSELAFDGECGDSPLTLARLLATIDARDARIRELEAAARAVLACGVGNLSGEKYRRRVDAFDALDDVLDEPKP